MKKVEKNIKFSFPSSSFARYSLLNLNIMKSSKLYCSVDTDRKSDRSFGADERVNLNFLVGTSKTYSESIAEVSLEVFECEEGFKYNFFLNHERINTVVFNKGSRVFTHDHANGKIPVRLPY